MRNAKDDKLNILEIIALSRQDVNNIEKIKCKNNTLTEHKLEREQIADWLEELDDRRNDYHTPIEYYGAEGTKDNVKEYKKLCKELAKERKKNKGEESNVECLIIDKITELISKMKLVDIRKLKLFE